MKRKNSIIKVVCLQVALMFGLLGFSSVIYGQTSNWNGSSWDNGAPSSSTASYTFVVASGTYSFGTSGVIMKNLNVLSGASCNINKSLTITGTLTVGGACKNSAFIAQTINNILVNSTGTFTNNSLLITSPGSTCTINNIFNNNGSLFQTDNLVINASGQYINGLNSGTIINSSFLIGGYFSKATFTNSYTIFDPTNTTIRKIELFNSRNIVLSDILYDNTNVWIDSLVIRDNSTLNIDTTFNTNYLFLKKGSLIVNQAFESAIKAIADSSNSITGTGTLTSQNSFTLNSGSTSFGENLIIDTLNILNGSSLTSKTGTSPTLTVNKVINTINGSLLLPSVNFTYALTSLTLNGLNGKNSAIAYINKPSMVVNFLGVSDTVKNCTLRQVTVNSGTKGYISNGAAGYKIQRIDASDQVTIASLPKADTIKVIGNSGYVLLTGDTRVNRLVDIGSGGSLTSNGNLTMRDSSNLYFADGQIVGDIKWQRKYGSSGWILMGVPFRHLNRGLNSTSNTGGIAQQTIHMNRFLESKATPRWVAVLATDTLGVGTGYDLGMTTIANDTLIFTGQPRLLPVTVSGMLYTPTNGQFDYQRGYNLVANPFTAPISIDGFFADNPNLNKIYFYDNIYQNNGLYVIRTKGGILTPDTSSVTFKNRKKISASYIAPNEGFFIKLDSTNYTTTTSVTFNPSSITRAQNDNFLKSAPVYLRLYAKNSSGIRNDIIIQFNDAATGDINPAFDFSKMVSDSYPLEIYSIKRGGRFSIQAIKLDTSVHMPIGLIVKNSGTHIFWVNNFDALPSGCDVYIFDKVANRCINLKDSTFAVSLSAGTYDTRFELVFKDNLSTGVNQPISPNGQGSQVSNNSVVVRSQNGQVFVDFTNQEKNIDIQTIDLSGRVLFEEKFPTAQGTVQLGSDFSINNIYIIKITGDHLFKNSKLLIQ